MPGTSTRTTTITLRVPHDLVERLDALVEWAEATYGVHGRQSRTSVARLAIAEGLRVLEVQRGD